MDIAEMQNARLGVIYLWQGTKTQSSIVEAVIGGILGSAGGILGANGINIPIPDQTANLLAMGAESKGEGDGLKAKIVAWAKDFVAKVWSKIKEVFGDVGEIVGHLKSIALFVAQQVFTKVAPIIGSVSGLITGLWKTTVTFCEKLSNWIAKKGVTLVQGHPQTLIKGIDAGLNRALLEGLYETAKSSLLLGLNIASSGAASIIEAVAKVIEAATKIIWRVAESVVLKRFCAQAKEYWIGRNESNAIHLNSMEFDKWLKKYTQIIPVIAAVTLGSGIAGDKMRFLQMYSGHGQVVISQDQFSTGVKYLDQMKRTGSRLVERSGINFSSDDKMIDGLHKLAKKHDEVHAKKSFWKTLFRTSDKIMRAT